MTRKAACIGLNLAPMGVEPGHERVTKLSRDGLRNQSLIGLRSKPGHGGFVTGAGPGRDVCHRKMNCFRLASRSTIR
jgi:hypothetical protein